METRIQSYLRALASRRPDTARVGPFLAALDPHSDNPYRNYALPDDGAAPSPADVGALIAAIGVIPAYRRRGVAGALCSWLARAAFASGVTVPFLTPAGEPEERIYARAGFTRVGAILHISRPRTDADTGA